MNNISLITENDLCISCGVCKPACPYDEIAIKYNSAKGFYEPTIGNSDTCLDCLDQPCLRVCPSFEEDFNKLAQWSSDELPIGPYVDLYTCYSKDSSLRSRSSSGGIIRELCRHFLEQGVVDGVITLRHIGGLDYEPTVFQSIPDFLENSPGSIYHNVNFERATDILRTTRGKFLLIAIPCQLTGIKKWIDLYPEQSIGKVVVTVGLICGWMFSRRSVEHFSTSVGIDPSEIENVSYRGGGKVGNLVISTPRAKLEFSRRPQYLSDSHYAPFRVAFSRTQNSQRCLLCVEHLNYNADVSVGDAWLNAFQNDTDGVSIVISRTETVNQALKDLETQERIHLMHATEKDVVESQGSDFSFGHSARQVISFLESQNKFAPRYTIPLPYPGKPSLKVIYKNYVNPSIVRWMAKHGLGYTWFRLNIIFLHMRRLPVRIRSFFSRK